jgi:hypothetical protein
MMHGFYHNPNGPAIVSQDGKVKQYWLNGSLYSEYDYFKMIDSDYDRSAALMPEDIGALIILAQMMKKVSRRTLV